jgi:hypothetical protein
VGVYDYAAGGTLQLIAGDALFAVIDEAKYRLRRAGPDVFVNAAGDSIPFRRDARGAVVGFVERGALYRAALGACRPPPPRSRRRERRARGRTGTGRRPDRGDGIPVGDIARTPLGAETAARIVGGVLDGTWPDVHGVLLYHGGRLVLEEYFYGYGPERPHQLRSATKSVVSALVGAAVARGALQGVDEPVLARLPYGPVAAYGNPDPRKARVTLGDLLTMRPGLACDDHDDRSPGRETVLYESPDWVKATLDLPAVADPGVEAHYCSGAVAVAGRVVERAVRAPLPAFADTALFRPLGIAPGTWRWNYALTSANREFAQLHLRPRDMLKLGLLYAGRGRWRGPAGAPRALGGGLAGAADAAREHRLRLLLVAAVAARDHPGGRDAGDVQRRPGERRSEDLPGPAVRPRRRLHRRRVQRRGLAAQPDHGRRRPPPARRRRRRPGAGPLRDLRPGSPRQPAGSTNTETPNRSSRTVMRRGRTW